MASKKCSKCAIEKTTAHYIAVNSKIHNGSLPICRECIGQMISNEKDEGKKWNLVNKLCQWADIPFIPEEWDKIYCTKGKDAFGIYCSIFRSEPYNTLDWNMYNEVYLQLKEEQRLEDAIPTLKEKQMNDLRKKWGMSYDDEQLGYLESLHQGLITSQNIVGALNEDQALKLCKISLEIEGRIRAGEDFDKLLKSYDTLVKIADFTPRNAKNANDFDSVGEIFRWLEKRGWKNQYFNGVTKDIVDETLHNIQAYNQRLYTNESGIGDEITERIRALQNVAEYEQKQSDFNTDEVCDDFDKYENDGYNELMKEEFDADVGVTV